MFEFLQSISDFFQTGIYEFFQDAAKYFTVTLMIWWVKAQIYGLEFAWSVASSVLSGLNITSTISGAFASLSPQVSAAVNFFRMPEAINVLLTAGVTRFVLNFIPFL